MVDLQRAAPHATSRCKAHAHSHLWGSVLCRISLPARQTCSQAEAAFRDENPPSAAPTRQLHRGHPPERDKTCLSYVHRRDSKVVIATGRPRKRAWAAEDRKPIELAEGWSFMQNGINKLIKILEGEPEDQFNAEQYMNLARHKLAGQFALDCMLCICPVQCTEPCAPRCCSQTSVRSVVSTHEHTGRAGLLSHDPHESECLRVRRTIYNMCTQKPPHDYSEQLYGKYREAFNQYITDKASTACLPPFGSDARADHLHVEQEGLEAIQRWICSVRMWTSSPTLPPFNLLDVSGNPTDVSCVSGHAITA
eukprot:365303-Chlamydomonas_euryale.AAC.39